MLDLTKFEGYGNASALLEDLKIDTAHTNDFSRVAVVGERSWMEWGTRMVNLLARSEMRWFDSSEEVDAVEWVQKGKKA